MIKIKNKKNCSGCHACENICPKKCIEMKSDKEGFLYPFVHKDNCVDCGLCEKICPIINKRTSNNTPTVYACVNKNEEVRSISSSGGIFSLFAEQVINAGGVVFGAAFNDDFSVSHRSAKTMDEVSAMYGSKYVQSIIGSTYKEAKQYLDSGKPVLFSGTACQIGGLLSYLGKKYDNLICMDIICHGVPSPKVWKTYLDFRMKQYKSKVKNASFRSKRFGWNHFSMKLDFENGDEYIAKEHADPYIRAFLWDLSLRPCCFKCNFKGTNRESDITLADFWGVERYFKEFSDDKGTSCIWANTDKGKKLFESIKDQINCKTAKLEDCLVSNTYAVISVDWRKKHRVRRKFFNELDITDFDVLADKYVRETTLKKKARVIYYKLKKLAKR